MTSDDRSKFIEPTTDATEIARRVQTTEAHIQWTLEQLEGSIGRKVARVTVETRDVNRLATSISVTEPSDASD